MASLPACFLKLPFPAARRRNCRSLPRTHLNGRRNRSDITMTSNKIIFSLAIVALMFGEPAARAQKTATGVPDITGSWERARDASIPAQPQPPLKPQYLKEYQAKLQALREAN